MTRVEIRPAARARRSCAAAFALILGLTARGHAQPAPDAPDPGTATAPDDAAAPPATAPPATTPPAPPATTPPAAAATTPPTEPGPAGTAAPDDPDDADAGPDLADMSLEELLAVKVVTASNISESQSRAPGVVIRLTREDMEARGYHELLDIFDDLPGMDVVRPWGDNYLKVYWRGYRTDTTQPFLLMVDGMVVNSLWSGDGSVAAALPISEIDHVEIVYGPASAVYGANAFMGVVNVITLTGAHRDENIVRVRATTGSFHGDRADRRILDGVVSQALGDGVRLTIGGRLALNATDATAASGFEYSRGSYATDPALWGGYLEFQNLARGARSPIDQYGLDVRLTAGNLELGVTELSLETGYGLVYATDRVQPYARWIQRERSAYASYSAELGRGATSRSMVRVRDSGIASPSYFLSGFDEGTPAGRVLEVSYWQAANRAISASEDVEVERGPLSLVAGARYERKDLQSAYDVTIGPHLAPGDVDADVTLPAPPSDALRAVERPITDDYGVYAQARLRRAHVFGQTDTHALHVGVRYDYNSAYGAAHSPTLRLGYVGEVDTCRGLFLGKLLYGEGFQEPTPRQLYGGWLGSGSSPSLRPENSRTVELNLSHTTDHVSNLISAYYVQNYDTITQFAGGASNKGKRKVIGVDYHLRALVRPRHFDSLSVWAYYSYLWSQELSYDANDQEVRAPIGDLATHQIWLGATAQLAGRVTATLRARGVGDRATVATNPVRSINGAVIFDATVRVEHVGTKALSLALSGQNLLGTRHSDPGIRTADSGDTPGAWVGGQWQGSAGYYNSRLPQPGRLIMLTLGLDL
jgi:outer membrane cobalamin receptor